MANADPNDRPLVATYCTYMVFPCNVWSPETARQPEPLNFKAFPLNRPPSHYTMRRLPVQP